MTFLPRLSTEAEWLTRRSPRHLSTAMWKESLRKPCTYISKTQGDAGASRALREAHKRHPSYIRSARFSGGEAFDKTVLLMPRLIR